METLSIYLLGEFRLAYDGVPVTTLNTQRLQSLLAYIVLFRRNAISRQQLAFLLWPDSSEAQARTNLRNLLHTLNKALPDADTFLALNGSTLEWRLDAPYTLDVQEFETALQNAAGVEALEHAIALYRGELLPGVYDDWLLAERERLEREFTSALEKLIDGLQAQQAYRQAITYAQQLARHDPLREDTYRRLMELHALNGDRSGVVRIYNQCEAILKRELDVEPSRETRQAYQRALTLEPPAAPAALPPPSAPKQNSVLASTVVVPARPFPPPLKPEARAWYLKSAFLRDAAYGGSIALSVVWLAGLVFAFGMPLLWALPIAALSFAGLFFMFNWGTRVEIARLDLRDEIRQKLYACRMHVWEMHAEIAKIRGIGMRQRVERICAQAGNVLSKLEQDSDMTLTTVSRFEFVLGETQNILKQYVQLEPRDKYQATVKKIDQDLMPRLETTLAEFAATVEKQDVMQLETSIRVLENLLKTEGIG